MEYVLKVQQDSQERNTSLWEFSSKKKDFQIGKRDQERFPGKRHMANTVELVECHSHHVQCKLEPTVALLGMTFNLSSNNAAKFSFCFKCYKRETRTHKGRTFCNWQQGLRDLERSRTPKTTDGDECQNHCGPHQGGRRGWITYCGMIPEAGTGGSHWEPNQAEGTWNSRSAPVSGVGREPDKPCSPRP